MGFYAPHAIAIIGGQTDFGQRIFCAQQFERRCGTKIAALKNSKGHYKARG
jgi:hypothetical protein